MVQLLPLDRLILQLALAEKWGTDDLFGPLVIAGSAARVAASSLELRQSSIQRLQSM